MGCSRNPSGLEIKERSKEFSLFPNSRDEAKSRIDKKNPLGISWKRFQGKDSKIRSIPEGGMAQRTWKGSLGIWENVALSEFPGKENEGNQRDLRSSSERIQERQRLEKVDLTLEAGRARKGISGKAWEPKNSWNSFNSFSNL